MDELMLHAGAEALAIPGPSVMPDRVMREFARPMTDIYHGALVDTTEEIFEILPTIAGTAGELFVSISNGHGAWEMALTNTLSRGDKVLVLNCGIFAAVWGEAAKFLGLEVEQIDASDGRAVDPDVVAERLAADTGHEIAAILVVHADTASSARNDIAAIGRAVRAADHPALLMVDCIASFGCEPFEMDAWGVDVMVAASQKGMMTPPGLGFNFAGERALAAREHAGLATYYWDWTSRRDTSQHYLRYAGTPPVSHLFALREALRMIDEEGLAARYDRHRALALAVHAAVDAWSADGGFSLNVTDPAERCHSVTTVHTGPVDAAGLREYCQRRLGITLGIGLRGFSASSFRIGHMGFVSAPMLLGVLAGIDTALDALGVKLEQSGAGAAASVLADQLDG